MIRYNAPLYGVIGVSMALGLAVAVVPSHPFAQGLGLAVAMGAAWFGVASAGAFYWLFDRSELLDGQWLSKGPSQPRCAGAVRPTARDGRVVLIEHTRNLAAALAYGPGWLHFMPAKEWRNRAMQANLEVLEERFITPFVQVFVLGAA